MTQSFPQLHEPHVHVQVDFSKKNQRVMQPQTSP